MADVVDRSLALAELVSLCEPFIEPILGTEGAFQVETGIVVGQIGPAGAGNAQVEVTASGMAGSPKTLQVPVANDDTAYQVATKIRAALTANADVNGFFEITGVGVNVVLTTRQYATHDPTMNLSINNGTCSGLTAAPTSDNTQNGSQPNLTELEAILDRHLIAATFLPSTVYKVGEKVVPTMTNGHRYVVVKAGTSGVDEPSWQTTSWPYTASSTWSDITSGDVTFREDGVNTSIGYDIDGAAYDAWNKKAARASQFVKTPGVDMSGIHERCVKMRDSFDSGGIA